VNTGQPSPLLALIRLMLALIALMAGISVWAMGMGALRPRAELAFTDWNGLGLVDAATGLTDRPVRFPGTYRVPAWSPDGSRLAFESNLSGSGTQIYVMDADGRGLRQLTDQPTDSREPVWSPNGRQLAYTFDVSFSDQDNEIYVLNLDSNQTRNLTQNPANDYNPRWSPDGRQIVFLSNRDHLNPGIFAPEVYVMNTDGSDVRRLTHGTNESALFSPAWSPDSRMLSFAQGYHASEISLIRVVDSRTGQEAFPESVHGVGTQAVWSPDGAFIAYAWDSGIYVARADGTERPLLLTRVGNLFPEWSPDGRQIAFVSQQNSEMGLFVVSADGRNLRRLTDIGTAFPSWRP
jgi:Tol biopolymer transport system component